MPPSLTTGNTESALFLLCRGGRRRQRRRTTGCVCVCVCRSSKEKNSHESPNPAKNSPQVAGSRFQIILHICLLWLNWNTCWWAADLNKEWEPYDSRRSWFCMTWCNFKAILNVSWGISTMDFTAWPLFTCQTNISMLHPGSSMCMLGFSTAKIATDFLSFQSVQIWKYPISRFQSRRCRTWLSAYLLASFSSFKHF